MTLKQLMKFIRLRNTSGHASNLQFSFDASAAGFNVNDLGKVTKSERPNGVVFYEWQTPHGTLVECNGQLSLVTEAKSA